MRSFQLKPSLDSINTSLEKLDNIEKHLEENTDPKNVVGEFGVAVQDLLISIEEFAYCFEEVRHRDCLHSLWQAVASAYWRDEEGWSINEPWRIKSEIDDITAHTTNIPAPGPHQKFERFIQQRGSALAPDGVSPPFQEDVYEARGLLAIGYYSTALLVLDRAVEKALLTAGRKRKVNSITAFGSEKN